MAYLPAFCFPRLQGSIVISWSNSASSCGIDLDGKAAQSVLTHQQIDSSRRRRSAFGLVLEDQAGKQRKSVTDGLGRLTSVYEAPNDTTNVNFQTSYLYDALGNLKTVSQGSQTRTFIYDSLSRLTSATNPESGTINYSYDGNGNLLTKTDARYTTTHFTYDGLNRVTQRSYDGGSAFATPSVNYSYDAGTVTNSKGRLTSVSSSVSGYNYTDYDALGRVTSSQQITDGQTYSMSYSYDLAGNMTSQTYPTGRVVTQTFDAAGRLANISGQALGGTPKTYANSFGYTAHGAVERMRLGNGRWEHTTFNNRLHPTEIGLGSSATDSSVLKLNYEYGSSNNGNVLKQVITVPTIGSATGYTASQNYQYDQLDRLTGAQDVNGTSSAWQTTGTLWQQKFSYDRYGNRAVDTANTTSTMIGPNPEISTTNNRITPRPGEYYFYDDAGNMTRGQGGETLDYEAENKLVQYQGGATQSGGAEYCYDGDGRRVKKATPAETLIFVYNISAQLVAEYTTSAPENNGTSYLTSDTLGTPRVITKADGSVRARHDYLPFGEELYAGVGNRTGNQGQGYDQSWNIADKTRQKFTQKERDNETGLDYFGARYYSPSHGRFTGVDPREIAVEANRYKFLAYLSDPQNWNHYSYALNSPLTIADKDGREPNKGQAGTAQQVVGIVKQIEKTNPNASRREILRKVEEHFKSQKDKEGNVRYVFTKEGGWIDMKHFSAAANVAADSSIGEVKANLLGLGVEVLQTLQRDDSAFSYEDMGSNSAGADFGDDYFDPNGGLVSEQMENYFENTLQATDPKDAPNWQAIPNGPETSNGSRSDQSTNNVPNSTSNDNVRKAKGVGENPSPQRQRP